MQRALLGKSMHHFVFVDIFRGESMPWLQKNRAQATVRTVSDTIESQRKAMVEIKKINLLEAGKATPF